MMEKVNFTPDEREAANAYIRAQLKRASEDDYIREEERKRADIRVQVEREKADRLLQKAEDEKVGIAKKLLSRGLSMEDVAEDTGLDYNEINKLI